MPEKLKTTAPDPYLKLRPAPPTPEEEICHCGPCREVMLRDSLGDNPLYCVTCNGEVAPEGIGFDVELAEDIASWRSVHRSLYLLWLDSREYEGWAKEQLQDPNGSVNIRGRDIVWRLNRYVRTYYWWFNDTGADAYVAPEHCPMCTGELAASDGHRFKKCDTCAIMI